MTAQPAAWHPDPLGRYERRYWDGQRWTEHVVSGGVQQVDPLGTRATPVAAAAFAQPDATAAVTTTGGGGGQALARFMDSLGPDARRRPDPRLSIVFAGIGGLLVGAAITALILGDEGSKGKVIGSGILLVVISLAIRFIVTKQAELRSSAVGAGTLGIGLFVGGLMYDSDSASAPSLVLALAYFLAWALPGLRGRPVLLGLAALALVVGVASLVGDDGGSGSGFDVIPSEAQDVLTDQGTAYLVFGGLLMGGVWLLDRKRYHGVATSLVVAGLIASTLGVALVVSELGATGGSFLATIVGAVVCYVGGHGSRRATTWWGALITAVGLVSLFGSALEPDTVSGLSTVLFLSGAALIAVPLIVLAIRESNRSNASTAGGPSTNAQ
ncbi:MAG: DUF2510 domain-containing protein [Ilumatobacteraceae bacterium]